MNEFFSWELLTTIAGSTAAVTIIVQFLKKALPANHPWLVRAVVYILSLGILLAATAATGTLTLPDAGLCVLNAVIVALASMGAYEATFHAIDKSKEK